MSSVRTPKRRRIDNSLAASPKRSHRDKSDGHHAKGGAYRKGSIVRIEMKNFLTYLDAVCDPGPHLNFVIGPNGSGKSSLVAAILIGLAGNLKSLLRSTDLTAYIMNGKKEATVRITLYQAAPDGSNMTISRTIFSNGESFWKMNESKATEKAVKEFVQKQNIQVNNLTVFLAQKQGVAFAKLSPKELLQETQKAIDPVLREQQQRLVEYSKQLKEYEVKKAFLDGNVENTQRNLEDLREQKERYEERKRMLDSIDKLKEMRPWFICSQEKRKVKELKAEFEDALQKWEKEAKAHEPKKITIAQKDEEIEEIQRRLAENHKHRERLDKKRVELQEKLDELIEGWEEKKRSIETLQDTAEQNEKELEKTRKKVAHFEATVAKLPDEKQLKKELDLLNAAKKKARDEMAPFSERITDLQREQADTKSALDKAQTYLNNLQDAKSRRLHKCLNSTRNARRIHDLIKEMKDRGEIEGEVVGPLGAEFEAATMENQAVIETAMGKALNQYVCMVEADSHKLNRAVRERNLYGSGFLNMGRALSAAEKSSGRVDWKSKGRDTTIKWDLMRREGVLPLDDLVIANDRTKAFLREACGTYRQGFIAQYRDGIEKELLPQNPNDKFRPSLVYGGGQSFQMKFSRYGNRVPTVSQRRIWDSRLFDVPVDPKEEAKLKQSIARQQQELQRLLSELDEEKKKQQEAQKAFQKASKDQQDFQKNQKHHETARKKLAEERKNVQKLEQEVERAKSNQKQTEKALEEMNLKKVKLMADVVKVLKDWTAQYQRLDPLVLDDARLKEEKEQLKRELKIMEQQAEPIDLECRRAKKEFLEAHKEYKALEQTAKEGRMQKQEYIELLHSEEYKDLEGEVAKLDAKISVLAAQCEEEHESEGVIQKYLEYQASLDKLLREQEDITHMKDQKARDVEELKGLWVPALKAHIAKIHEYYSKYFASMDCQGSVGLAEDDDFDKYGLEIKVAFRKNASLLRLTANTQSGGERSVSTMLFLLCLQQVTDCPFRVVDEINQGMDALNERMIFNKIVDTSSQPNNPQYFLFTPTLLPNLYFSPQMKILTVFNGAFQAGLGSQGWQLDKWLDALKRVRRIAA